MKDTPDSQAGTQKPNPPIDINTARSVSPTESDTVSWQADDQGGIRVIRTKKNAEPPVKTKAAVEATVHTATLPDISSTDEQPDLVQAVRWWKITHGWREKAYNVFLTVAKLVVTVINFLAYALSFGKMKQLVRWEPKQAPAAQTPQNTDLSNNDDVDWETGNYDALTLVADAASKLPNPPTQKSDTNRQAPTHRKTASA
jgi:hypothetical protein